MPELIEIYIEPLGEEYGNYPKEYGYTLQQFYECDKLFIERIMIKVYPTIMEKGMYFIDQLDNEFFNSHKRDMNKFLEEVIHQTLPPPDSPTIRGMGPNRMYEFEHDEPWKNYFIHLIKNHKDGKDKVVYVWQ